MGLRLHVFLHDYAGKGGEDAKKALDCWCFQIFGVSLHPVTKD
jgi:hypothetical protein